MIHVIEADTEDFSRIPVKGAEPDLGQGKGRLGKGFNTGPAAFQIPCVKGPDLVMPENGQKICLSVRAQGCVDSRNHKGLTILDDRSRLQPLHIYGR